MFEKALKAECPECGMEIPARAKLCMFCGCVFSDKERKELIRIASGVQRVQELKIESALNRGKSWKWLIILSGGSASAILIVVSIIQLFINTDESRAFGRGLWIGFLEAILALLKIYLGFAVCGLIFISLFSALGGIGAFCVIACAVAAGVFYFSSNKGTPVKRVTKSTRRPVQISNRRLAFKRN